MKAIITGMNGTVSPVVAKKFKQEGISVVPWDRNHVPIDNINLIRKFLDEVNPDFILHIATGSTDWVEKLSFITYERKIKFLFTSSASVFSGNQKTPISTDVPPDAEDDYGKYKIECEKIILHNNKDALIVRLGWQIADKPGSNNMVDYIFKNQNDGIIKASVNWFPASSFIEDTADAVYSLIKNYNAGIFHIDGNPDMNFFQIVSGLNNKLGFNWKVESTDNPVYDNRMKDERVTLRTVKEWLSD